MNKYMKVKIVFGIIILLVGALYFFTAFLSPTYPYLFSFVGVKGTFIADNLYIGDTWINPYWFIMIGDIFIMCLYCIAYRKRINISCAFAFFTGVIIFVLSFIGAKIMYILENVEYIKENGLEIGGLSFFGVVFFLPLAIPVVGMLLHKKPMDYLEFITPPMLLYLAIFRIGCFTSGCCEGLHIRAYNHYVNIPAQLIECALDLFFLTFLEWLIAEEKCKGRIYFVFMIGYGSIRFLLEFIRTNSRFWGIFTRAHGWALLSVIIGIICYVVISKKKLTYNC